MKKLFLLVLILFFISGCDVNYELEINGKTISENKIFWYEKDETDSPISYTLNKFASAGDNGDSLYSNSINEIKDNNLIGAKFLNKYSSIDEYKEKSLSYGTCFSDVQFDKKGEYIELNIKGQFLCYDTAKDLDTLTLSIKTNHKVQENNANIKKDNTYSWKITKENADNTNIHLKLYSDKYVYNYDNVIFKRLGIVFLIICVTIVIALFIKRVIKNYQINSNKL